MDLAPIPQEPSRTSTRPLPVTLISLYEFAKGAYILYAFNAVWALHQASPALGQVDTDPIQRSPFVLLLPIFALVILIAGAGLWFLQGWARRMFLFGGTLAFHDYRRSHSSGVGSTIISRSIATCLAQ